MLDLFKPAGGFPLWISGTTYPLGFQVISPGDLNVYIRKVAGAGTTDPKDDATNWKLLRIRPMQQTLSFGAENSSNSGNTPLIISDHTGATITSTSAGAPTTAVNVIGAGILSGCLVYNPVSVAGTTTLTVEIDGVPYTTTITAAAATFSYIKGLRGCYHRSYDGASLAFIYTPSANIPFYKSLKISGYKSAAGINSTIYHAYSLEV